jgi:hypothetical protein
MTDEIQVEYPFSPIHANQEGFPYCKNFNKDHLIAARRLP